ncbi:MAG: type 2 isopentenyl-diphosphate Delta-isomerase [DPANN group archaeon]|nr:type 2 isopentenyl-diphosphate Delta-isomerase [DPANN group archaeon]
MSRIHQRKQSHVDVALNKDISYHRSSGLERYAFIHNALPDLDFKEIDTSAVFLGKKIQLPLIISGMTGGHALGARINRNLAMAAEKTGIAMGIGSQRIALEHEDMHDMVSSSFDVRKYAPSIPLLANLGAAQLNKGYGLKECRQVVEQINADALVFHLNPLQEVIQGGDVDWKGILPKIGRIVKALDVPVIVKEVGFGISDEVGRRLDSVGVHAIDVSGSGGTSWAAIESRQGSMRRRMLGRRFWDWGIPTAEALQMNKGRRTKLIAGGGIRSGQDMAKSIALGADYCTMASPFLKAAADSPRKVMELILFLELELRTAMFGIGVKDLKMLKGTPSLRRLTP